jgi:peptidoglycan hydrolase-like protein with peptidoglycan-binding domain
MCIRDRVERIQGILTQAGYQTERNGFYGDDTAASIEQMQEDFGLKIDGSAGQDTMVLLSMFEKGKE